MSITVFTKPKSILSIVVALVFIFDANLIMQLFGMSLDDAGIMMTRILGGAYLGLGISFWFINGPDDIDEKSAYLYGCSEGIASLACLAGTLNGALTAAGWTFVVGYFAFSLCFFWVAPKAKG